VPAAGSNFGRGAAGLAQVLGIAWCAGHSGGFRTSVGLCRALAVWRGAHTLDVPGPAHSREVSKVFTGLRKPDCCALVTTCGATVGTSMVITSSGWRPYSVAMGAGGKCSIVNLCTSANRLMVSVAAVSGGC
jgi:hypothetical protein